MKAFYEPDCNCSPAKPRPKVTEYETGKLPIAVGFDIECFHCGKSWRETCAEWGHIANREEK